MSFYRAETCFSPYFELSLEADNLLFLDELCYCACLMCCNEYVFYIYLSISMLWSEMFCLMLLDDSCSVIWICPIPLSNFGWFRASFFFVFWSSLISPSCRDWPKSSFSFELSSLSPRFSGIFCVEENTLSNVPFDRLAARSCLDGSLLIEYAKSVCSENSYVLCLAWACWTCTNSEPLIIPVLYSSFNSYWLTLILSISWILSMSSWLTFDVGLYW